MFVGLIQWGSCRLLCIYVGLLKHEAGQIFKYLIGGGKVTVPVVTQLLFVRLLSAVLVVRVIFQSQYYCLLEVISTSCFPRKLQNKLPSLEIGLTQYVTNVTA